MSSVLAKKSTNRRFGQGRGTVFVKTLNLLGATFPMSTVKGKENKAKAAA